VLSGRGLCDGLITRPEESYQLWCVLVCDLETSRMRWSWPELGCCSTERRRIVFVFYIIIRKNRDCFNANSMCSLRLISVFQNPDSTSQKTPSQHWKYEFFNTVPGKNFNRCLFCESGETHKYTVWVKCLSSSWTLDP
jgi:hypothetical protein